jgi:CD36 family
VFSFREALEHENVTFNLNGTLSYIPRRFPLMTDKLVLDTSLGRGLEDRLVVPNIPLLVNNALFSDMHNIFETKGVSNLIYSAGSCVETLRRVIFHSIGLFDPGQLRGLTAF